MIFTIDLGNKNGMSLFKDYSPEQAYLLPPSVRDELSTNLLCFCVLDVVERLGMTVFEQS